MEVRMMKKTRKVRKEPSPSAACSSFKDADVRQRFKYQSLLQDHMELLEETEAKKKKLQKARQKKLQLLAEVSLLSIAEREKFQLEKDFLKTGHREELKQGWSGQNFIARSCSFEVSSHPFSWARK
ncbi:cytochrome c oxidase copper chaperone, partial [Musa troglodytarum]